MSVCDHLLCGLYSTLLSERVGIVSVLHDVENAYPDHLSTINSQAVLSDQQAAGVRYNRETTAITR